VKCRHPLARFHVPKHNYGCIPTSSFIYISNLHFAKSCSKVVKSISLSSWLGALPKIQIPLFSVGHPPPAAAAVGRQLLPSIKRHESSAAAVGRQMLSSIKRLESSAAAVGRQLLP